jgi:hypothetical protein
MTPADLDHHLNALLTAYPQDLSTLQGELLLLEEQCVREGPDRITHALIEFALQRLTKVHTKVKNIKKQVADYDRKLAVAEVHETSIHKPLIVRRLGELATEAREQLAAVYASLAYQLRDQRYNYDTGSLTEEEKFLIRARASQAHEVKDLLREERLAAMTPEQRTRKVYADRYRAKKKLAQQQKSPAPDES